MAREHAPIRIGVPAEQAWAVDAPAAISYIAFIRGDEAPDPGAAFIAAGESFGVAPRDVEPLPIDDDRVEWAFAFTLPTRATRVMLWCERASGDAVADGGAADVRWGVFIETLLEEASPVDDAVALAATVARAGGARTVSLLDPGIALVMRRPDIDRLLLSEPRGALVDERQLYRIEIRARDRERGPFWITTVGMSRVGRPEFEMFDVPGGSLRTALEVVDATASRFVAEELPHARTPFDLGRNLPLALVPVAEFIATVAEADPGSGADRKGLPPGPRAAICSAEQRGAYRRIWVAPTAELERLARSEAALFLAPRVSTVRERVARAGWSAFVDAWSARTVGGEASFHAKVAVPASDSDGEPPQHVWVEVDSAGAQGGTGTCVRGGADEPERIEFAVGQVGDWRIFGLRNDLPEVGAESVGLLERPADGGA